MVANKKSNQKQIGIILINIKGNKKSKNYIFSCGFCNTNCDQLKKFSLHLDEKHSEQIWEDKLKPPDMIEAINEQHFEVAIKTDLDVLEPQVKIEELMEFQAPTIDDSEVNSKISVVTKEEALFEDPLETEATATKLLSPKLLNVNSEEIKKECEERFVDEDLDVISFNCNELDYEDSVDESDSEEENNGKVEPKTINLRGNKCKKQALSSDMSLEDSDDSDFKTEKEHIRIKRVYRKRKAIRNEILKVDPKVLTIAILEAFEKQPLLWKVGSQSQDKVIRQNAFESIAEEAGENLKIKLTCEFVRKRIKEIRNEYCQIRIKQREGEQCENPWYTEHAKFLEENIKALMSNRRKRNRRLKTLDESRLSLFIEYYKNSETLWKVDNITFVLKSKRIEALESIMSDLKTKHNIQLNKFDVQRSLEYINHLYTVERERQLKCELNKMEFVPSSKVYKDLSFLSGCQGPFLCSHCNELFYKYEIYHQHVAEHTKILPFKCALCEMRFSKLTKYVLHAKRHLGLYDYNCKFCGKGYAVKPELDLHERQHTGEEPYLCDICGTSFKSRDCYNNHKLRHENRFRYECHICKQGFNHKPSLRDHIKLHLNVRDILCNICGKGFATRRYLLHHQLIHSDTKRYKCRVCGKAFAQGAGMRAHQKLHK